MYSKATLILLQIMLITGCSWWGGENTDNRVVKFDESEILGTSSECLDGLDTFFSTYFKGLSQERDIKENLFCIKDMSGKIFEYAQEGSVEKGFSRSEIYNSFKAVFPNKDQKSIEGNVELLFLVKRLFIGGEEDGFSRSEKEKFDSALVKVEQELIAARVVIKHLFYFHEDSLSSREKSFDLLRTSFESLDSIRKESGGVIVEEESLSIIKHVFKDNSSISKFRNIALVAKRYLFGSGESFLNSQGEFFTRIFNALEVQSRLHSVDFSDGFLVGKTFYDLQVALEILTGKLRLWSSLDESYSLHIDDVKDLVFELRALGVMRSMFTDAELVNKSFEKFLLKIFKSNKFTLESFEQFYHIIQNWIRRPNRIISKYEFPWAVGRLDGLRKESVLILDEIGSFHKPQFLSGVGKPVLLKRDDEDLSEEEEYFDSSLKHTLYTLIFEFFKAYSSNESLSAKEDNALSLEFAEVKNIFDDLRPLALEMGFANPYTCNSENRSFVEADSLTLNGNGDNKLSINEAVEWMGTMISVGSVSKHMFDKVEPKCGIPGIKVLGYNFVSRSCAAKELFGRSRVIGSYFPSTLPYLELLNSEGRKEEFESDLNSWILTPKAGDSTSYSDFLSTAFNTCGQEDFPLNRGELNSVVAVNYYLENIFYQFDKTGLKSWVLGDDPKGSDFIIDGGELSNFLEGKLSFQMDNLVKLYEDKYPNIKNIVKGRTIKNTLTSLPEASAKFDRISVFGLVDGAISGFFAQEPHQYEKNYCNDVYSSFKKNDIFYRTEERLMCTPD
ncbi:MAG: hypothetical protein ACRBBP_04860 [Bdellovibrionales bacterium]